MPFRILSLEKYELVVYICVGSLTINNKTEGTGRSYRPTRSPLKFPLAASYAVKVPIIESSELPHVWASWIPVELRSGGVQSSRLCLGDLRVSPVPRSSPSCARTHHTTSVGSLEEVKEHQRKHIDIYNIATI